MQSEVAKNEEIKSLRKALEKQVENAHPNMWSREMMRQFIPILNEQTGENYQQETATRRLRRSNEERQKRFDETGIDCGVRTVYTDTKKEEILGWVWVKYEPVEVKRAEPSKQEQLFEMKIRY